MLTRYRFNFAGDSVPLIYSNDTAYVDPFALGAILGLNHGMIAARLASEPLCRGAEKVRDTETDTVVTLLRLNYAQMFLCTIHRSLVRNEERLLRYQLDFRSEAEVVLRRLREPEQPSPDPIWNDEPARSVAEHRRKMFPRPAVIVPGKNYRNAISQLIRSYCHRNDFSHERAWRELYREAKYRLSIDLTARSENTGKERLDIAEELGLIEQIYAIAYDLFTPSL